MQPPLVEVQEVSVKVQITAACAPLIDKTKRDKSGSNQRQAPDHGKIPVINQIISCFTHSCKIMS